MRAGVRQGLACALAAYAAIACSVLTDYSLGTTSAPPEPPEAGGADADVGPIADGSVPGDAGAIDADAGPTCTETPCIVQIAAAGQATCARASDGAVRCWGWNNRGITGSGATNQDFPTPTQVAFDGPVDDIAMGGWGRQDTTACARRGSIVECWGDDSENDRLLGRAGASSPGRFNPVPAPVPGVSATGEIAIGSQLACARSGSALTCWGRAYDDALYTSPIAYPSPKPVKQIVGGRRHHCVLLDSEEVACSGTFSFYRPLWNVADSGGATHGLTVFPGVTGVTKLSAQATHVCALKKGGSVVCWGRNQRGELGRGVVSDQSLTPAPVTLPAAAKDVGTAANHSCAVLVDDSVWCWGRNGGGADSFNGTNVRAGQVGALADGGVDEFTSTARKIAGLPTGAVGAVAGGYAHSCALMLNGAVYCWGSNRHGQLGRGGSSDDLPHPAAARVVF